MSLKELRFRPISGGKGIGMRCYSVCVLQLRLYIRVLFWRCGDVHLHSMDGISRDKRAARIGRGATADRLHRASGELD